MRMYVYVCECTRFSKVVVIGGCECGCRQLNVFLKKEQQTLLTGAVLLAPPFGKTVLPLGLLKVAGHRYRRVK